MGQAWKSINEFIVSFTSSFDQLKIYIAILHGNLKNACVVHIASNIMW